MKAYPHHCPLELGKDAHHLKHRLSGWRGTLGGR
jgi:hypothetical protein